MLALNVERWYRFQLINWYCMHGTHNPLMQVVSFFLLQLIEWSVLFSPLKNRLNLGRCIAQNKYNCIGKINTQSKWMGNVLREKVCNGGLIYHVGLGLFSVHGLIKTLLLSYAKRNQLSERNLISICIRSFIIKTIIPIQT